ncbi:recombinase family protein [Mesobacillus zeae]|uniref:Recombinase family protein n=1 Tax=Mesobacillus zeae TaxID=1917180 RepID=A0A398BNS5_9BACI|nr:recombinase family protein [Mesobacillus zeae]RID89013.1 recombinase family protein [Mesobacillus zeae]
MSRLTDLDIFLYLRKSRKDIEEERKDGHDTLQRHRTTLLAVARKERHNIRRIYEEVVSGESISERPEIQTMLRAVEAGEADAVLVVDLDRLGRGDMLDQGLLDRAFRYSNTKVITPTEMYDPDSQTWELVFGIKSLVAREELKAITRRLQSGRVSSASEGKSISKKPPYGYARDENLRLVPDIETAWVVRKMFEMMRDGHGRQQVANELDRLGIKPPNPKRDTWSPSSITAIIKNEAYLGKIIWGVTKYTKRNGKYTRKKMPRDKWTIKENAHDPLVSQELFDAANKAHTGRWRPSTKPTNKLSNPLAGILKCGVCGYTMLYQPRKDRPSSFIRCNTPSCRSVQKGSAFHMVENQVIESLRELESLVELSLNKPSPNEESAVPYKKMLIEKKLQEVGELDNQKGKLHDLLERGIYDVDTFVERQQNLVKRIDEIKTEINQIEAEIQREEIRQNSAHVFLPTLATVLSKYPESSPEKKNELLKLVIESATYIRKKDWEAGRFEIRIKAKL